ncbi:hypothetical protein D3C77_693870 [compost metagenome]
MLPSVRSMRFKQTWAHREGSFGGALRRGMGNGRNRTLESPMPRPAIPYAQLSCMRLDAAGCGRYEKAKRDAKAV